MSHLPRKACQTNKILRVADIRVPPDSGTLPLIEQHPVTWNADLRIRHCPHTLHGKPLRESAPCSHFNTRFATASSNRDLGDARQMGADSWRGKPD
jgi:hypothetical protein